VPRSGPSPPLCLPLPHGESAQGKSTASVGVKWEAGPPEGPREAHERCWFNPSFSAEQSPPAVEGPRQPGILKNWRGKPPPPPQAPGNVNPERETAPPSPPSPSRNGRKPQPAWPPSRSRFFAKGATRLEECQTQREETQQAGAAQREFFFKTRSLFRPPLKPRRGQARARWAPFSLVWEVRYGESGEKLVHREKNGLKAEESRPSHNLAAKKNPKKPTPR